MSEPDFLSRGRPETCLSDLLLDRLLAGELAERPEAARAEAHLTACASCARRREALRAEAERFPAELFVSGAAARTQRALRRWWVPAAASAVAAAAALWLLPPLGQVPATERLKGGDTLQLVARYPDGRVEPVLPGGTLSPGDAIRFQLSVERPGQLTVLGVDAARQVTRYFPQQAEFQPIPAGRGRVLEGSIILDDTLGPERVIALICEAALPPGRTSAAAARALEAAGGNPARMERLEVDCRQASFLFHKAAR